MDCSTPGEKVPWSGHNPNIGKKTGEISPQLFVCLEMVKTVTLTRISVVD
jgi:hypothetical protein